MVLAPLNSKTSTSRHVDTSESYFYRRHFCSPSLKRVTAGYTVCARHRLCAARASPASIASVCPLSGYLGSSSDGVPFINHLMATCFSLCLLSYADGESYSFYFILFYYCCSSVVVSIPRPCHSPHPSHPHFPSLNDFKYTKPFSLENRKYLTNSSVLLFKTNF